MNISEQDQNIILQDTVRQIPDSTRQKLTASSDTAAFVDSIAALKTEILPEKEIFGVADTTSFCQRSGVYDLIFYDPENGVKGIDQDYINGFPFLFIEINRKRETGAMGTLTRNLKDGKEISSRPYHEDWIIIVVIFSAFLYAALSTFYGKSFHEIRRFLLFTGIGDPASRDTVGLFHRKSTLFNFVSFFNIALFGYYTAVYYDFAPFGISGMVLWLILFLILIIAVTLRYVICYLTGKLSGADEAFGEYAITVYQSYRLLGFILFMAIILLSYTDLFPSKTLFSSGFFIVAVIYFMRLLRLLIIFLKRNISLLYLILYLCGLEFLPVLILVKFFTDQF